MFPRQLVFLLIGDAFEVLGFADHGAPSVRDSSVVNQLTADLPYLLITQEEDESLH